MKTLITAMLIVLSGLLTAQSAEEMAIKEACQADTEAYMKRDFEAWAKGRHQVDHASMLITGSGTNYKGWEAVRKAMEEFYNNNSEPQEGTFTNDNYMVNLQGDHAYVHYEQTMTSGNTVGGKNREDKTYEARNMIKVDGQWKIFNQVTTPMVHEKTDQNVIARLTQASIMLNQMERAEAAGKIPKLVAEWFPDYPSGHWGMGYYAVERKDKASALKHLEKAMSLFDDGAPDGLKALYERAQKLE